MGNLEQRRRGSEIRGGGKKVGAGQVSQVDKSIQKEAIGEDADEEDMRSCNRCEGGVCTEKREGISIVEREKRRSKRICKGAVEKRIYLKVKVTTDSTSILCREEGQKEVDSARLQVSE